MKKIIGVFVASILIYFFVTDNKKPKKTIAVTEVLKPSFEQTPLPKQPTKPHLKLSPKKKHIQIKTKKIVHKLNPDSFIPIDQKGNLYVSYINVLKEEKLLIAHGDIIVGNFDEMESYSRGEKPLLIPPPKIWKDGIIPYEIAEPDGYLHEVSSQTINYFNKETALKFVPRKLEDKDFIRFETGQNNCYSRLGRQGGKQIISLSTGCTPQKVAHEILHSLGFLHEQNREDRDQYITILWQNIENDLHVQFKKIPNSLMPASQTEFSFNSIMLYPSTAFSMVENDYSIVTVDGEVYVTTNDILNEVDLKRIELLYREELNP
jgi:hypothetical protein